MNTKTDFPRITWDGFGINIHKYDNEFAPRVLTLAQRLPDEAQDDQSLGKEIVRRYNAAPALVEENEQLRAKYDEMLNELGDLRSHIAALLQFSQRITASKDDGGQRIVDAARQALREAGVEA